MCLTLFKKMKINLEQGRQDPFTLIKPTLQHGEIENIHATRELTTSPVNAMKDRADEREITEAGEMC